MKNNKKKKKVKLIYKITVGVLFLVSIIFVIGLISLNILTTKLLALIIIPIIFIDFLFWLFITKSKKKKISSVLAFFVIIVFSISSFYLYKTNDFINKMTSHYKTYNFSVVTLADSKYKTIKDLDKVTMGYLSKENEEINKSIKYINKKISPKYIKYKDYKDMTESLLKKETESIIIEESYLNMMKEENYEFSTLSKVITTFKIRIKIDDFSKDINVTKKTFHIYISGIDTYGTVDSVSRSDVNMVVTINPITKQILMTSIPRDYYITLHGIKGYNDKLTHAGLYGIDMSVKTIEDLLNIEINYYIKVNFTSVIDIVDALKGVEVYSDYSFTSLDNYNYKKGYNKVTGEEALSFARERKAFKAGDNQRIKNQQALLQAIFKRCISKDIIYKYNNLLNSLEGSFITNMPSDRITDLIKMQLKDMSNWTITSNSLTGSNGSNYTYSYSKHKVYVMDPDEESIEEAHKLITSVIKGEILENSYKESKEQAHAVTKSPNISNITSNNDTPSDTNKKNKLEDKEPTTEKDKNKNQEIDKTEEMIEGEPKEENNLEQKESIEIEQQKNEQNDISLKENTTEIIEEEQETEKPKED